MRASNMDATNVASIANSFVKANQTDATNVAAIHTYIYTYTVRKMRASNMDATNVASIANSFVKANQTDATLFRHLATMCMRLDPLLFDAQVRHMYVCAYMYACMYVHVTGSSAV